MKKIFFLLAAICPHLISLGQTDSTNHNQNNGNNRDTIIIGNMIIIKKGGNRRSGDSSRTVRVSHNKRRNSNTSTNWAIVDLGFNNFTDNTNYASNAAQQFAPGSNEDWFNLRNGKSINVNIWFFMQRLNLVSRVVNLKYGLGLELNNYSYENNIRFTENPTMVYNDLTKHYNKVKLAADYVTVPLMLNFNFTPNNANHKSFGLSVGASAGYLYSSRQKFVTREAGKQKVKDDFDMRPYKISYIAELQAGPIQFYGSMATRSMFEKGLDQTPYNIGIRLSSEN
jgi:hypothetical protein